VAAALAKEQTWPHVPQLAALVAVLVSQPFAALPSQSPKSGLQPTSWHVPVAHAATPFG
jgi:hypothetical protein